MIDMTLRYGIPGHEREWIVIITGFNHGNYIPTAIADDLQIYLPETAVFNRGSRIEIMTDDSSHDLEQRIRQIISQTFLARPWLEEMRRPESQVVSHDEWRAQLKKNQDAVTIPLDWKADNDPG